MGANIAGQKDLEGEGRFSSLGEKKKETVDKKQEVHSAGSMCGHIDQKKLASPEKFTGAQKRKACGIQKQFSIGGSRK